jgi:hypothetical protein
MATVAESGGAGRARFASSRDDVGQNTFRRTTCDDVNWRAPRLPHAPATCSACPSAAPGAPEPHHGHPPLRGFAPLPKMQPPASTSTLPNAHGAHALDAEAWS